MPDDARFQGWRPKDDPVHREPPPRVDLPPTHVWDLPVGPPLSVHLDPAAAALVEPLLAPALRAATGATHPPSALAVTTGPGADEVTVVHGGRPQEPQPGRLVPAVLLSTHTEELLAREPNWAHLHAAGAAHDGEAILVPGPSGHGKTSLVCHLAAGAGLLNDEIVAIDDEAGVVRGSVRPVSVKETAWPVVAPLVHPGHPAPGHHVWIPARDLGSVPVAHALPGLILLTHRRPGPVELEERSPAEGLEALLQNAYDQGRESLRRIEQLAWLAANSRCLALRYEEARDAVAPVRDAVGSPHRPVPVLVRPSTLALRHHARRDIEPAIVAVLDDRAVIYEPVDRYVVRLSAEATEHWLEAERAPDHVDPVFADELRSFGLILEGTSP